ncbi:MAG TPA: tripartite tricarboxylate transporter substrate binding protein [Geminicoccaceae bacterium]|jgi:putative tricarboxylic transport membrane protein|nr:tripartite tricarboxylate transporter substrate binding protein [Geminicoccaceae bacterium]
MDDHGNLCRFDLIRRRLLVGVGGVLALGLGGAGATAQDQFPSKTIELISHASPGGGTDVTARAWMSAAEEILGEDIVIVYKQGGAARAAHEYFMGQPSDGHTVMALTQTHLYTLARGNSPMEIDDMLGLVRAMDDPSLIVVRADSDIETYEDLIEASKEQPLNWGVAQVGGTEHIGIARWAERAGIEYRVVPFGSGGEMLTALRSGAIDATVPNVSEAKGLVEEGEVRPLAVMDEERLEDFPDLPTTYEKGHETKVTTTRGYAVRADTPPEIVEKLESALLEAMKSETFAEYLRNSGLDPEDSVAGSEQWDAQLKEEHDAAKEVIERLGL